MVLYLSWRRAFYQCLDEKLRRIVFFATSSDKRNVEVFGKRGCPGSNYVSDKLSSFETLSSFTNTFSFFARATHRAKHVAYRIIVTVGVILPYVRTYEHCSQTEKPPATTIGTQGKLYLITYLLSIFSSLSCAFFTP